MTMPAGRIRRIHVDQHRIKANAKVADVERTPPLTIQTSDGPEKADEIYILDGAGQVIARIVYRPEKPLSCGAKVWIETEAELVTVVRHPARPSQEVTA